MQLNEQSHRRLNLLTGEWVLVSPHRTQRPWQGAVEKQAPAHRPQYDPNCYLCPGNRRAGGATNPNYASTFVFENDFAALKFDAPAFHYDAQQKGLLVAEGESGICRVMCFSPRHDLTLASMSRGEIEETVRTWTVQFKELGALEPVRHVQIFENRGEMMGASNPHPHCQIWATSSIPVVPSRELVSQRAYLDQHGGCLLCDYLNIESQEEQRIIAQNRSFVALVPFWAVWPFEVLLCSKHHVGNLGEIEEREFTELSDILKQIVIGYDRVFDAPFPYSMGFHQSPTDNREHPEWHFHAHFYPPLLRSASIRKFMVGFEMLGTPQRDITPEVAAEKLRSLVKPG